MIRKVYVVNALELTTFVVIDGKKVSVHFKGGCYNAGIRYKAKLSTTDERLQKAIESHSQFNKTIFLDDAFEIAEKREDVKEVVTEGGIKQYPLIKRVADAKDLLYKEYGISLLELTNKLKIKEAAASVKVEFPNL